MNTKKELELFIEEAKSLGVDTTQVDTPTGIQFKYGSTRDMFSLWCRSANREGYSLVPIDKLKSTVNLADQLLAVPGDSATKTIQYFDDIIGAQK